MRDGFAQHALRGLAGLAMVLRADASKAPEIFTVGGWFVAATSVMIVLAPRRWHHAFALWCAARIPERAWPAIGLVSFGLSGALAWAARRGATVTLADGDLQSVRTSPAAVPVVQLAQFQL